MSSGSKAVFLSYASQDAEAARRICDALRGAGTEVWFDQNELVGGDAWDGKIRKQIAECALFIPVISEATQARREGYFRIEWRLAAQRTHAMSDDTAFLLPVVIDDTPDADARVPAEFKAVQWTRLRQGFHLRQGYGGQDCGQARIGAADSLDAFCERVRVLLAGEVAPVSDRRPGKSETVAVGQKPAGRRSLWMVPAILAAVVGAGLPIWKMVFRPERPAAQAATPVSEARQLAERARVLMEEGDDANRENFTLAEQLLQRAVALEPVDGEVLAIYAELSLSFIRFGVDRSEARQSLARTQAERAIKLAPDSFEAKFALAYYYYRHDEREAERLLRDYLRERPTDKRLLRTLGNALRGQPNRGEEAIAIWQQAAALPGGDALALREIGLELLAQNRFAEAEAALDESIKLRPMVRSLWMKVSIRLTAYGDVGGAMAVVDRLPAWALLEDRGAYLAAQTQLWRRQPDAALAILNRIPRDYFNDNVFTGPKSFLIGQVHEVAGRHEAAKAEWSIALGVIDRRLAAEPRDELLLYWRARLLALLGRQTEAEQAYAVFDQTLGRERREKTIMAAKLQLALGRIDGALDDIAYHLGLPANGQYGEALTPQVLRLDPTWDPLRGDPRFEKLIAAAQPPAASSEPRTPPAEPSNPPRADSKSVVVLPFANLSGDPEQEYFSDGLTEEILNALARERDLRVPGRASAFSFKGKGASAAEIAKALNVAQLVEGSVRKAGNRVRISVQLTRASDGFSEALPTVERELTDIFALQDEVARLVVEKLTRRTSTTAPVAVLTKVPEAYDAYLRGRVLESERRTPALYQQREALFQQALKLDPNFAEAWGELARVHALYYSAGYDSSPDRVAKADAALAQAQRLAPASLKILHLAGDVAWLAHRDAAGARAHFEKLAQLQPNNPEVHFSLAPLRRLEEEEAAVNDVRRATELDPGNYQYAAGLASRLSRCRRWEDAMVAQRRAVALRPGDLQATYLLAELPFKARGSPEAAEAFFAGLSPAQASSPEGLFLRKRWAFVRGDLASYLRLDREMPYLPDFITEQGNPEQAAYALMSAAVLMAAGDAAGSRARLGDLLPKLRAQAEREPGNVQAWTAIGGLAAILGHPEEARRAARRAVELDPRESATWRMNQVIVEVWAGDKNRALDLLAEVMRLPSGTIWTAGAASVHDLKLNAFFTPVKDNRRFQALLNDPKNNAPLF